jgi:hypothetical protein
MFALLRALFGPRRWARRLRAVRETVGNVRTVLAHQLGLQAELRELHLTSLTAAIHLIVLHQQAREDLARDYARLEARLYALERRLAGAPPADVGREAA